MIRRRVVRRRTKEFLDCREFFGGITSLALRVGVGRAERPTGVSGLRSGVRWGAEGAEGAGHGAGGFPAVSRLFLQGLQQDSLQALGGVGAEGSQGERGVLEDDLVGVGWRGSKPR